jgi:hypothetical protein
LGTATAACGKGGQLCHECPLLSVCGADQQCGSCGPDNCPRCCSNGTCMVDSTADASCGQAGEACADCTVDGKGCSGTSFTCVGGPEPLGSDGQPVALNIMMGNLYAESIFTLDVTINARTPGAVAIAGTVPFGTQRRVLDAFRIGGNAEERRPAVMLIDPSSKIDVAASIVSLGQTSRFTASTTLDGATLTKDTLGFVYNYDVALATFGLRYDWIHLP